MTRRQLAAALASALCIALAPAGCKRDESRARGVDAEASHIADAAAPKEAHRIVSVVPAMTETLFAIGAGDRVVGRSRYCDWPPEAQKLPVVGGFVDVDVEAVVGLSPDLVVGVPGPPAERLAQKLAPFGIATWFPALDSIASIETMIQGMGERSGHAADGARVARALDARVAEVERAVAGEPAPRVLLVVDVAPVVGAGPGTFLGELLRRAGGVNVLPAGAQWQTVDFEQIVELDPDVVLDASVMGGASPLSKITPDAHGWSDVRAVREGRVVPLVDARVLRPGPRVPEALALLARALHPRVAVPSW